MTNLKTFQCPKCKVEKPTALRFDRTSSWCTPCVEHELLRQDKERYATQFPQVVEYAPEDE